MPVLALAALLLAGYVLLGFALWKWQSRLIFYPLHKLHASPAGYGVSYQDVRIATANLRESLHGWWMPATLESPVILYLHGNGGNIGAYAAKASCLRAMGYSVLIVDYRGYGQSVGPFPSEGSVYADAETAWGWLTHEQGIPPAQTIIYGHSLGGAIAVELARRHPEAAGLIVESSFTSIRAMARCTVMLRAYPLRALVHQQFDSLAKLRELRMPVFFMHGTHDLTVPCFMSRELHAAAPEPKNLLIIPGAGHMNCHQVAAGEYRTTVMKFAELALARPRPVTRAQHSIPVK